MIFTAHIAHAESIAEKVKSTSAGPIVDGIMNFIVIPVMEGLFIFTILIFIWGVVDLIAHADDPTARAKGQQHILWGVIGLFIMISAYGIVRVIGATIGTVDPTVTDPFEIEANQRVK